MPFPFREMHTSLRMDSNDRSGCAGEEGSITVETLSGQLVLKASDAEAYLKNFQAFKDDSNEKQSTDYYNTWCTLYEQDLCAKRYRGPAIAADAVARHLPTDKDIKVILDVAAGTGFVGQQLGARGFELLDALEPSEGMAEMARAKGVYRHIIQEYLGCTRLDVEDETYDCCVSSGGMGQNHIPPEGFLELLRITKRGGIVVTVMREENLRQPIYQDKLEPLLQQLEEQSLWKLVERSVVPNYFLSLPGLVLVYRKC